MTWRRGVAQRGVRALLLAGAAGERVISLAAEGGPRDALTILAARRAADLCAVRIGANRADAYRAVWEDAAREAGARLEPLPNGYLAISRDSSRTVVRENLVALDDALGLHLAGDKATTHALLSAAGLPTVRHQMISATDVGAALALLDEVGACVVKPARNTGGGLGVVCDVRTGAEMVRALLVSGRWGEDVIVEEQLEGMELRFLVLDGEVVGVLRRHPPTVVGDGVANVAALVHRENGRRAADGDAQWVVRVDLDMVLTLHRQDLTLRSVPPAGVQVRLKRATNANAAAENHTVEAGPTLLKDVQTAVAALGLRWAAVEVITGDADASLADGHGRIIEINSTPGILYHYQVQDVSRRVPVARLALAALLAGGTCSGLR
jgi:D-alanine-D-alanine ligase-like ATP-grasp enzyme